MSEHPQSDPSAAGDSALGQRAEILPDPEYSDRRIVVFPGADAPRTDPLYERETPWFRALGYSRAAGKPLYHFHTKRGQQVLTFTASELGQPGALFSLAPRQWWQREMGGTKGFTGEQAQTAQDELIECALRQGIFRSENVRGRGVWLDAGRVVVHAGNRLVADGEDLGVDALVSEFVYEAQARLAIDLSAPAPASESRKWLDYCKRLNWAQPVDGVLMAGWVVAAMACGALLWRPHAWLTGRSGSGKSTLLDLVFHLLGPLVLRFKGETTPAGARQRCGPDALAMGLDEAESDDEAAQRNVAHWLRMLRSASSDLDGAEVVKGGGNGVAVAYALRSSVIVASVGVAIHGSADASRISVFELQALTQAQIDEYETVTLPLAEALKDPAWAAGLRARVLTNVPVLRANAKTFGRAVARRLQSARLGDQIGTLLAGAYLLARDGLVDQATAEAMVGRQRWEEQEEIASDRDEERLLAALLETRVRVLVDRVPYDASLGELVGFASGRVWHSAIRPEAALAELGRHGVLTVGSEVMVSNTHREIGTALRGTPWAASWKRVLKRIDGARATPSALWYGGVQSRGTALPLDAVLGLAQTGEEAAPGDDDPGIWEDP